MFKYTPEESLNLTLHEIHALLDKDAGEKTMRFETQEELAEWLQKQK